MLSCCWEFRHLTLKSLLRQMITIIFNLFLFCFAFWLISPKLSKGLHQTQTLATSHKNVPAQSLHVSPFWSTKSLRGELRHFLLCVGCSGLVCTSPDNLRQSAAQLSWFKTVCPGDKGLGSDHLLVPCALWGEWHCPHCSLCTQERGLPCAG